METSASGRRLILFLSILLALLILLVSGRYYARLDLTLGRRFSVSDASKRILDELSDPVRITYYVSPELTQLYPQTRDIGDFLSAYASESPMVSVVSVDPIALNLENALAAQGIAGRSIQSSSGNSTGYTTVYSAILIEYLGRTQLIPFVLSSDMLEYELSSRLMLLMQERLRPVMLMAGNGMDVEQEYSYVAPWLESAGFSCQIVTPQEFLLLQPQLVSGTLIETPVVLFGSSRLSTGEAAAAQQFVESGGCLVLMASSTETDIYGEWSVAVAGDDALLPVLREWGVVPATRLVCDVSCFRMTLYSDDNPPRYESVNYPLWVSALPQYTSDNPITDRLSGMIFFWANPLEIHSENVFPLVYTSPAAWALFPDENHSPAFVTNPFMMAQTASAAGSVPEQFVLAAEARIPDGGGRVVLVADQHFVSTAMLDYTGAASNLEFLVNTLLSVTGEDALLSIRNRTTVSTALDKVDESVLLARKNVVIVVTCVVMPLVPSLVAVILWCARRIRRASSSSRSRRGEKA